MEEKRAMRKLKEWFLLTFLPGWAKETVLRENHVLQKKLEKQQAELERLNAYVDGLEFALRRRVIIRNEVGK